MCVLALRVVEFHERIIMKAMEMIEQQMNAVAKKAGLPTHINVTHEARTQLIPVTVTVRTPKGKKVQMTSEAFSFYRNALGLGLRGSHE